MTTLDARRVLEAALLCAGQPMPLRDMQLLLGDAVAPDQVRELLDEIADGCADKGYELVSVASGWRFQSRPEMREPLSRLSPEKPARYSRAVLETLAIVAYRQPVTRGDIEDIRGVTVATHIVKQLEDRGWIESIGHRESPGRPALFATTRQFLDDLGLASLEQLPLLSGMGATPDAASALPDQPSLLDAARDAELQEDAAPGAEGSAGSDGADGSVKVVPGAGQGSVDAAPTEAGQIDADPPAPQVVVADLDPTASDADSATVGTAPDEANRAKTGVAHGGASASELDDGGLVAAVDPTDAGPAWHASAIAGSDAHDIDPPGEPASLADAVPTQPGAAGRAVAQPPAGPTATDPATAVSDADGRTFPSESKPTAAPTEPHA